LTQTDKYTIMGRKDGKPRGRMSSYAFFVQTCREEHKKKCPDENVVFAEFTKKCAQKWKEMSAKEKRRFEEMAERDKSRYEKEMANYDPPAGGSAGKRKKRAKDPSAPKRALSAFFFFCGDERPEVRAAHPEWSVAEVAKELGKRWEKVTNKSKYEARAEADKARYAKEMEAYRGGGAVPKGNSPAKKAKAPPKESDEDEDDDDDDDEDDDE